MTTMKKGERLRDHYPVKRTFKCYTCNEERKNKEKSLVVYEGGVLQQYICKYCARRDTVVFGQSENLNTYDWEADKRRNKTWLEQYKNFMKLFKKD